MLVAAALLSRRARVRGSSYSTRSMALVTVIALLTFFSLSSFWGAWEGFRKERRANAAVTPADAATRGGAAAGANVAFVEWLNSKLPPGAPFYVRTNGSDEATYQWLTYRLYPRIARPAADQAHWLVFLKVTPAAEGFDRREFSSVEEFAPDLVLAERRE